MNEKRARELVYNRSDHVCEVCGAVRATNWHHRMARSQRGTWTPSNGLHVCGSGTTGCHGKLTNTNGRRAEYEARGWIVRSWQVPADIPVMHSRYGLVYLDDTGGFRYAGGDS